MPKASKSKGQSKLSKAKASSGIGGKIMEDKTFGAPPRPPPCPPAFVCRLPSQARAPRSVELGILRVYTPPCRR